MHILFILILSTVALGQSSKSAEVPNEILTEEERIESERQEEEEVRREWDKKEQEAQRLEEVERIKDEREAEQL